MSEKTHDMTNFELEMELAAVCTEADRYKKALEEIAKQALEKDPDFEAVYMRRVARTALNPEKSDSSEPK